jgi:hypothetical protein
MAMATMFSTEFSESSDYSKSIGEHLDKSFFDSDLMDNMDKWYNESNTIMDKYLTKEEHTILEYIVDIADTKPSLESTKNTLLLTPSDMSKHKELMTISDDDDDANRRRENEQRKLEIELLKSLTTVNYANIQTSKLQNEYSKYQQLKSQIVIIKRNAELRDKKIKDQTFAVQLRNAKIGIILLGTTAAVTLNIGVICALSIPATWSQLILLIYKSQTVFNFFLDLMGMLDVFNMEEKMSLKSSFNELQNDIANNKNNIPYDKPDVIEKVAKLLLKKTITQTDVEGLSPAELDIFFTTKSDGTIEPKQNLAFTKFASYIVTIIVKKNIIPTPLTNVVIESASSAFSAAKSMIPALPYDATNATAIAPNATAIIGNATAALANATAIVAPIAAAAAAPIAAAAAATATAAAPIAAAAAAPIAAATAAAATATAAGQEVDKKLFDIIFDSENQPYLYAIISALKLGGNMYFYISTTTDLLNKMPNIDSSIVFKGAMQGAANSDFVRGLSRMYAKKTTNLGAEVLKQVIGQQIINNQLDMLSTIPMIGGMFNANKLDMMFVTSLEAMANSLINGTINGHFKKIEADAAAAASASGTNPADDKNNRNKKTDVQIIEERITNITKYQKLGLAEENISELIYVSPPGTETEQFKLLKLNLKIKF